MLIVVITLFLKIILDRKEERLGRARAIYRCADYYNKQGGQASLRD